MGQRSQIYIHFNVGDNEGMVARYFQWNYGERMISRARSIMELLKDQYLEYKHTFGSEEYILKLNRFCDVNFDMRDMAVSTDILEECRNFHGNFDADSVFGQDNNDGQLLIDVTDDGIKYCFIDYFTNPEPMNAEQYMKWNTESEVRPDWHEPDKYTDNETIDYTERNIAFIDTVAELMTEQEVREFLDRDYNLLLGEHNNSKEKEGYTEYEAE